MQSPQAAYQDWLFLHLQPLTHLGSYMPVEVLPMLELLLALIALELPCDATLILHVALQVLLVLVGGAAFNTAISALFSHQIHQS